MAGRRRADPAHDRRGQSSRSPIAFAFGGALYKLDPKSGASVEGATAPTATDSTLRLNLIAQDLAVGQALAVLDPHGELVETVLLHVP